MENICLYMMKSMFSPTPPNSYPFKCRFLQGHTEAKDFFRFLMD
jgi:hypothetical protein